MKKIVLFTALLFSQLAFSQNFISENKLWHVRNEFWGDIFTWIYKIEGETVISSVTYKNLWATFDTNFNNVWIEGYIREESNVVYYRSIYNVEEGILYDFNLEAGDTSYITNEYCDLTQVIIEDIDTVEYFGVPRKRWIIEGWEEECWIEGIGSLWGPVHTKFPECIFDVWFELICFHENDTLFYLKPYEDECFQSNVGINEGNNNNHIQIRPNPVTRGQSLVVQSDRGIEECGVYHPAGLLINQLKAYNQRSVAISTTELSPGFYFIRIKTGDNRLISRKIVVL
jgi:hypothetical protein